MSLRLKIMLAAAGCFVSAVVPAAERDKSRQITLGYGKAPPPVAQPNPCLAHGPGFQAVPGTNSCVKVIGGVRMDATTTRKLR